MNVPPTQNLVYMAETARILQVGVQKPDVMPTLALINIYAIFEWENIPIKLNLGHSF